MEQNVLYYIQINFTCIAVLALMMYVHHSFSKANTTEISFLRKMILCTMVYCFADIFAWEMNGKQFIGSKAVLEISNIVYIVMPAFYSYFWTEYVIYKTGTEERFIRRKRKWFYLPVILNSVLVITTPVSNYAFTIDSAGYYHRAIGAYVSPILAYLYVIYAFFITIRYVKREKNIVKREEAYPLIYFAIPISIAGILQTFIYGISINQTGFTLGIILLFTNLQYNKISTDELTGLNNRHELKQYINNMLNSQNDTIFICMIDVDFFKAINDTYGHVEGDKALKLVATILKKVCSLYSQRFFLARYGGDEFVISGVNLGKEELDQLLENIQQVTTEINSISDKPYKIQLSAGYASEKIAEIDMMEKLFKESDEKMYAFKKARKEKQKMED